MQNLVSSRKCRFDSDHPHHRERCVSSPHRRISECDVANLAKVGVEGSNPFARSNFTNHFNKLEDLTLGFGLSALVRDPWRNQFSREARSGASIWQSI